MGAPQRRGFVLPFVILALAVVGLLALTFATVTLRDAAAVDRVAHAQRLAMAASAALAHEADRWREDSLWTRALHHQRTTTALTEAGDRVTIHVQRTHPLIVRLIATGVHRDPRSPIEVRRTAQQILWLSPPPTHLHAALTVHGVVTALDPTIVTGVDLRVSDTPCGIDRDTLSIAPLSALAVHPDSVDGWSLMPLSAPVPVDSSDHLAALRASALQRGPVITRSTSPAPLPVTNSSSPQWQLLSLQGSTVELTGNTHYRGLLLIEGDLTLSGTLTLDGLLVVRGTLDARLGVLAVNGAVVVLGDGTPAGQVVAALGASTQVRFDRCQLAMALATLATPSAAPFQLWTLGAP